MHISLVTIGGRGDIQPYIALGLGLQRAGHTVQIVTNTEFESFTRSYGLAFAPISVNIRAALEGDTGGALLQSGHNPFKFLQEITAFLEPMIERGMQDTYAACQKTDLILSSVTGNLVCAPVGEKLNVPVIPALIFPVSPTQAFPSALFPTTLRLGGWYNVLTHWAGQYVPWFFLRPVVNQVRVRDFSLAPAPLSQPYGYSLAQAKIIYGYSPTVLPKPKDWGRNIAVTGYWFLDRDPAWQPTAELESFLRHGARPICVSYGSMSGKNAERTLAITIEALKRTHQRAILITGWRGLQQSDLSDEIFVADSIPHDWLLPQVKALVHHGGAGTTAAAFRAGVPAIITPFLGDQPFWSLAAYQLGVTLEPIPQEKLTVEKMIKAFAAVGDDPEHEMQIKARAFGEKIRAEDGVGRAVQIINQFFSD